MSHGLHRQLLQKKENVAGEIPDSELTLQSVNKQSDEKGESARTCSDIVHDHRVEMERLSTKEMSACARLTPVMSVRVVLSESSLSKKTRHRAKCQLSYLHLISYLVSSILFDST